MYNVFTFIQLILEISDFYYAQQPNKEKYN